MRRPYWLLWVGLSVSRFGDGFLTIGVLWQIFVQTGSIPALAATYAAYSATLSVARILLGPLADRYDRRRLMVTLDLARAVLTAVPLLLALLHALPAWVMAAVYVGTGVLQTPYGSASSATLPRLVEPAGLARANSWLYGAAEAAHLLGPAVGGLVIAFAGAPRAVALDGLSFLLCAACVAALPARSGGGGVREATAAGAGDTYRGQVGAGWSLIRSRPTLGLLAGLRTALFATDTVFVVLFVPLVTTRLHGGAAGVGLLEASISAGAIVASWLAGRTAWRGRPLAVWSSVPVFCLATGALAMAPNLGWALALQAVAGLATGLFLIPSDIVYQTSVAAGLLGRAFAARGALVSAGRAGGAVLAGALAVAVGVAPAFAVVGLAGAVTSGALVWSGRRRDALAA